MSRSLTRRYARRTSSRMARRAGRSRFTKIVLWAVITGFGGACITGCGGSAEPAGGAGGKVSAADATAGSSAAVSSARGPQRRGLGRRVVWER